MLESIAYVAPSRMTGRMIAAIAPASRDSALLILSIRRWRHQFARHLREQGIAANATERAVRGETRNCKTDGIYRAAARGESSHMRARTESAAAEVIKGGRSDEPRKSKLIETREAVEHGWRATSAILIAQGHPELAADVVRFLAQMPPAQSEKELLANQLRELLRDSLARDRHPIR
ncbi:MAG TPA: hypothetical protein VFA39_06550 [Steroidobacteraceae bacterium]|nr:hypothetical protein [Steroidobacteraceae bacterium]